MTRKEQNKILDDKTESNINQYKVDRLNAEISAFPSGDLNKVEFLIRKDLKYKPNALDKARFEFSPLDKAFSMGLDKTAQGYQEKGVIKLLKDIRDGLRGGVIRPNNRPNNDNGDDISDNDDNDDNDDNTVHKLDNYIKENNDKKINTEKKLDIINNERNKLLLEYNQSNEELKRTNYKLDEAGNDINEKTKYIDELKEFQEKFDYQNNKVTELESGFNKKNKSIDTLKNNIKDLENENREMINKSIENVEIINKKHNQEIEKLEKKLKINEEYFNDYEENRAEKQKQINKLIN